MVTEMAATESVVEHHWRCFAAGDLPALMKDYDEESVLITNMGSFHGVDGIERLFGDLLADLGGSGGTVHRRQQTVEGGFGYVVWEAESADHVYEFAAETFYIPEETIEFQTLGCEITGKRGD
jgi:ketosteroid isomerase-like protein